MTLVVGVDLAECRAFGGATTVNNVAVVVGRCAELQLATRVAPKLLSWP